MVKQKDFNVFYNASTLIVIYSTFEGPFVNADCWLAAENFMLAAYAKGLGTCPIGLALLALNSPDWKEELNIPADAMAIAPIIVGWPAVKPLPTDRNQPTVFSWK